MKRKGFYAEYYRITDMAFTNSTSGYPSALIWRKTVFPSNKKDRKSAIAFQYLSLLPCLLPLVFGIELWYWALLSVTTSVFVSHNTVFSIIKIEMLYSIYRRDELYCSLLYDMFKSRFKDFREDLRRGTKKVVNDYYLEKGGRFYGKYRAVCRDPKHNITVIFKRNKVSVNVNGAVTDITDKTLSREQLISRMAEIINAVKRDGGQQNATG